jgi:hypothetical protein
MEIQCFVIVAFRHHHGDEVIIARPAPSPPPPADDDDAVSKKGAPPGDGDDGARDKEPSPLSVLDFPLAESPPPLDQLPPKNLDDAAVAPSPTVARPMPTTARRECDVGWQEVSCGGKTFLIPNNCEALHQKPFAELSQQAEVGRRFENIAFRWMVIVC